jgi:hypothetical protein
MYSRFRDAQCVSAVVIAFHQNVLCQGEWKDVKEVGRWQRYDVDDAVGHSLDNELRSCKITSIQASSANLC